MLNIKNLTFAHIGQKTPYEFNLSAAPGTITAITGPSGIGKSTLLDLIAGFLTPASGDILLNDQSIIQMTPELRPVSILFQADNLFDHLDVKTNLSLGLPKNTANRQTQILLALSEVGLPEFADRKAKNLSGGQQQRIALARTLLQNQPIVLLDEPFANLDETTANAMRDLVKRLTLSKNWHTLLVSHLWQDANYYADNSYTLSETSTSNTP